MDVWTRAVTGVAAETDDLALAHRLPGRDQEFRLMGVAGGEPAAVVDAGVVAVAAAFGLRLGEDDGAGEGGVDRRPFRDGDVDPGVVLVAGADVAAAETGGDRPFDRPDHPQRFAVRRRPGEDRGRTG